jgi:hypothetical protein
MTKAQVVAAEAAHHTLAELLTELQMPVSGLETAWLLFHGPFRFLLLT